LSRSRAGLISAPDDETMCKVALALGSLGNVRTETLRVFSEPAPTPTGWR